jgi:DNA-binding Lrp family transcriptional regulator
LKKYLVGNKNVRTFATVMKRYSNILCNATLCGETSTEEGVSSHITPKPHSCHTDATDQSESSVRYFSLQVRNKTLLNLSFNQAKSLALLLFVRMYQDEHNREAKDYTVNKLHEISNIHAETIKKRIRFLEDMGMIGYSERKQIVFLKARAHNPIHNTTITIPHNATIKYIEKIILAVRLQMKIRQKEYLRNVLSIARDGFTSDGKPARLETIKRAKKWLREHCNIDWHKRGFVDYGWSYKAIAKHLGVSIKQVCEILKFAIRENFIVKHTHSMYKRITSKFEIDYIQHTFLLNNYSYKVYSNTYSLGAAPLLESIR